MGQIRSAAQRQRDKIRSGMIISKLLACVAGETDMTPTQVRAASILLNKVLPDMKSVDADLHAQLNSVSQVYLTDEQLMAIASGAYKGQEAIEGEVVPTPRKLEAL